MTAENIDEEPSDDDMMPIASRRVKLSERCKPQPPPAGLAARPLAETKSEASLRSKLDDSTSANNSDDELMLRAALEASLQEQASNVFRESVLLAS